MKNKQAGTKAAQLKQLIAEQEKELIVDLRLQHNVRVEDEDEEEFEEEEKVYEDEN